MKCSWRVEAWTVIHSCGGVVVVVVVVSSGDGSISSGIIGMPPNSCGSKPLSPPAAPLPS